MACHEVAARIVDALNAKRVKVGRRVVREFEAYARKEITGSCVIMVTDHQAGYHLAGVEVSRSGQYSVYGPAAGNVRDNLVKMGFSDFVKENPMPTYRLESGYAYEYKGRNWRNSSDERWDTEVITPTGNEHHVGFRNIDGARVAVFRSRLNLFYAQLIQNTRVSENPISTGVAVALLGATALGVGAIIWAMVSKEKTTASALPGTLTPSGTGPALPFAQGCVDWQPVTQMTGTGRYRVQLDLTTTSAEGHKMIATEAANLARQVSALKQALPGIEVEGMWADGPSLHASYPANVAPPDDWRPAIDSPNKYIVRIQLVSAYDIPTLVAKLPKGQGDVDFAEVKMWFCPSGPKPAPMALPQGMS